MDKKIPDSFSEAVQELESLTSEFENDEVDLEMGIPKFKRGMELVRHLKKRLSDMENEIIEIKSQFKDVDETPTTPDTTEEENGETQVKVDDSKNIPF